MDLTELREVAAKERARQKSIRVHCCTSTGCQASQSLDLKKNLEAAAKAGWVRGNSGSSRRRLYGVLRSRAAGTNRTRQHFV
jgi:hypothetical protein